MTANSWVRGYDVASHSDPGKKYRVSVSLAGHYGCSCPAWKFTKKPKADCKHIVEVKTNLGLLNRVKGVERNPEVIAAAAPAKVLGVQIRTVQFTITELSAEELITSSKRKVRARDEF